MTVSEGKQIYGVWVKAWNGEISALDEVVSPGCTVHQARTDGKSSKERKGAEALHGIIRDGSVFFEDASMCVEVGPLVDGPYVSARWKFTGNYKGGMPGAKAEPGQQVTFHGMDIFRIENGKIIEYWVSSDGIHLMEQLGMF